MALTKYILWGVVKIHTDSTAYERMRCRVVRRSGEIPEPTVKVRMRKEYCVVALPPFGGQFFLLERSVA